MHKNLNNYNSVSMETYRVIFSNARGKFKEK